MHLLLLTFPATTKLFVFLSRCQFAGRSPATTKCGSKLSFIVHVMNPRRYLKVSYLSLVKWLCFLPSLSFLLEMSLHGLSLHYWCIVNYSYFYFLLLVVTYAYVYSQNFGDDLYEAYGAFDAHCNLVICYAIVDCLTFIFMK